MKLVEFFDFLKVEFIFVFIVSGKRVKVMYNYDFFKVVWKVVKSVIMGEIKIFEIFIYV